jgi:hypothetical protein
VDDTFVGRTIGVKPWRIFPPRTEALPRPGLRAATSWVLKQIGDHKQGFQTLGYLPAEFLRRWENVRRIVIQHGCR